MQIKSLVICLTGLLIGAIAPDCSAYRKSGYSGGDIGYGFPNNGGYNAGGYMPGGGSYGGYQSGGYQPGLGFYNGGYGNNGGYGGYGNQGYANQGYANSGYGRLGGDFYNTKHKGYLGDTQGHKHLGHGKFGKLFGGLIG